MGLNQNEETHYNLAVSAAEGAKVAGVLACKACVGCGLRQSAKPFGSAATPKILRRLGNMLAWNKWKPISYGVDVCPKCQGTGAENSSK